MHLPKDEQPGSDSSRTSIVSTPGRMFQLGANQSPTEFSSEVMYE